MAQEGLKLGGGRGAGPRGGEKRRRPLASNWPERPKG